MQTEKPKMLLKPTLDTKFHIDYDWWEREEDELRTYLITHLPPEVQQHLLQSEEDAVVDYVDPETGEVSRLDELGLALRNAINEPDFINAHTSLVDCVFRVFLANNNIPLTPKELAEATGRDAHTILKTLGGIRVYKGIRPTQ